MALIDPQTGASSTIYDPTLPARIARGGAALTQQAPIASTEPGQGPQYDPSFGSDTSPNAGPGLAEYPVATRTPNTLISPWGPMPATKVFSPSFNPNAPGVSSILAAQARQGAGRGAASAARGSDLTPYLGNVDARGAPYPAAGSAAPNAVQTAQAPNPAMPQGWNLFTALGQALGHLLGFNAAGQPQGMSGLIRNPVQTGASTQTAGVLRMPNNAARYQGRTLIG